MILGKNNKKPYLCAFTERFTPEQHRLYQANEKQKLFVSEI
jgi:hypothetical protein